MNNAQVDEMKEYIFAQLHTFDTYVNLIITPDSRTYGSLATHRSLCSVYANL